MKYAKVGAILSLLFALILISVTQVTMADTSNDFLAQDGRLQQKLELRDAQSGFVGLSGHIWTVEPSDRWYVARFVNEKIQEPYRSGQLTRQQLNGLAGVLAAQNFTQLPKRFGQDFKVNPRILSIRFGSIEKVLVLKAGEKLETASIESSKLRNFPRFREIFQRLRELCQ